VADPSIPLSDRPAAFGAWVSSYFAHEINGSAPVAGKFEFHVPLAHPPPTFTTMTPEEITSCIVPEQGKPDGSDMLIFFAVVRSCGDVLRRAALFPEEKSGWAGIEWRNVWCDHSIWDILFGVAELRKELERAREEGKEARKVIAVRWRGANHFVSSPS
jgi:hypothetical protein